MHRCVKCNLFVSQVFSLSGSEASRVEGNEIIVSAEAYAKSVEILNENEDMVLEDNYFDMNAGEKRVRIISGEPVGLKVRSVYDI